MLGDVAAIDESVLVEALIVVLTTLSLPKEILGDFGAELSECEPLPMVLARIIHAF
jgi:hypothetical protein